MPDYTSFVKKGTFLCDYMEYMSMQETSVAYDFWCGMWLIGNACGRSIYVDRPRAPVFLNWYVILVADSGITRKSTAVRVAVKTVDHLRNIVEPPIELVQTKITPEGLDWRLHELTDKTGHAHVAIGVSELVTVLGRERYVKGMPGLLTDLYDCDSTRTGGGTLQRGGLVQNNLFVSLLSASTPTWLQKAINPDVVEGGFTSRTLFVVSEQPKRRIAWPNEGDDDDGSDILTRFGEHLVRLRRDAERVGRITLNRAAMERFTRWYNGRRHSHDPFRNSFESREDAHVLRLAACLCANDRRWIIEANDIRIATRIVEAVKEESAALFEGTVTHSKYIAGVDAIRTLLMSGGMSGVAQQRITVGVQHYLKAADVKIVLDIMHELGMVQKFEGIRTSKRGRPKTLWRATNKITGPGAMEEIINEIEPV